MKRLLAAGAVVLTLLTVGACGSGGSSTQTQTPRQKLLHDAHTGPYRSQVVGRDQDIVDMATTACKELKQGVPPRMVITEALLSQFTPQQTGWLLGDGVAYYCPPYLRVLDGRSATPTE